MRAISSTIARADSVSMKPGHTGLTRTPFGANSFYGVWDGRRQGCASLDGRDVDDGTGVSLAPTTGTDYSSGMFSGCSISA
jgi:hypothetical protein